MLKLIDQLFAHPGISILFLLLITAAITASIFFTNFYNRFKKTEKDCERISPNHTSLSDDLDKLTGDVASIKADIRLVLFYIKGKDNSFDTILFTSKSPIELSELGMKLANDCGGIDYVNANLERLIAILEAKELTSALDVQNQAILVIAEQNGTPEFKKVKDFIFQNPILKIANSQLQFSLIIANSLIGMYLRNKYFEKHPELKEAEPSRETPPSLL